MLVAMMSRWPSREGNRHIVVVVVDADKVELAVAVQIAGTEAVRVRALAFLHGHRGMRRKREAAVPITEKKHHTVAVVVGERQVHIAITVEVAQHHFGRRVGQFDRAAGRAAKPPIALAEQHDDVPPARQYQVGLAISIHLTEGDAPRCVPDGNRRIGRERQQGWLGYWCGMRAPGERRDHCRKARGQASAAL
jgi:hypothetical protein